MRLICCMCNIVLVFCLYPMYFIYADYVFCINKVLTLFLFTTFFMICLVFWVYSVGKLSRGHFKACVWYAFYVCITSVYCPFYFLSVSVSFYTAFVWIKIIIINTVPICLLTTDLWSWLYLACLLAGLCEQLKMLHWTTLTNWRQSSAVMAFRGLTYCCWEWAQMATPVPCFQATLFWRLLLFYHLWCIVNFDLMTLSKIACVGSSPSFHGWSSCNVFDFSMLHFCHIYAGVWATNEI